MGFVESIKTCLSKYFVFSGRATRSEYWWFHLFYVLTSLLTLSLDVYLIFDGSWKETLDLEWGGPFEKIAFLLLIIPSTAVAFRRLHDVNISGWWVGGLFIFAITTGFLWGMIEDLFPDLLGLIFLLFAVLAGYIILLFYWMIKKSDKSSNKYAAKPAK